MLEELLEAVDRKVKLVLTRTWYWVCFDKRTLLTTLSLGASGAGGDRILEGIWDGCAKVMLCRTVFWRCIFTEATVLGIGRVCRCYTCWHVGCLLSAAIDVAF